MQTRFLIFFLLSSFTFGQTLNVDNVYNFSPHKLTKAEQEKKIPTLDVLWNELEVKDYLNVPGPLMFDNINYNLAWSSHPADNYYMQEYIPQGDNLDNFNKMILINMIVSNSIKPDEVVAAKISELTKMQKENPVIQFKAYDNKKTGEHIIDFLLSENEPDGNHLKLVERNVYRYNQFTDKSGQKGILLFGTSTRSYGHDIYSFFSDLKEHRTDMIMKVGDFAIPEITLTK